MEVLPEDVAFLLGAKMQERRRTGRWQIDSQASIKMPGQDNPFDCKIEDINFKGLKIHSSQELDIEGSLALNIALGYGLSFDVEAAVAWNKIAGADNIYGLYFTKIKESDKEKVYEFIREHFPDKIKQQVYTGIA